MVYTFFIQFIWHSHSAARFFPRICTHTASSFHRTWLCSQTVAVIAHVHNLWSIFIKALSVSVVGLTSDKLSAGVSFSLTAHNCRYVANSDSMQCSYKSENPPPFLHIGTQISFTLISRHNYDIANSSAFPDFKIVPPDALLPNYLSCDDFAAANMLAPMGTLEYNFQRFFFIERYFRSHTRPFLMTRLSICFLRSSVSLWWCTLLFCSLHLPLL